MSQNLILSSLEIKVFKEMFDDHKMTPRGFPIFHPTLSLFLSKTTPPSSYGTTWIFDLLREASKFYLPLSPAFSGEITSVVVRFHKWVFHFFMAFVSKNPFKDIHFGIIQNIFTEECINRA